MNDISRLPRIRLGVRAVLALGIVASIAANVLHAQDNPIARVISAWPPGALFITVEVISRVPVQSRSLSWARVAAAAVIAGIAAWVSYWHMVAVATRYGESPDSAHLLPLSVDGLVVVASICLFELGLRIRRPAAVPTATARGRLHGWAYRWEWIGRRRSGTPTAVAPTVSPVGASATTPTPTGTPDPQVPLPVTPTPGPGPGPDGAASPAAVGSSTTPTGQDDDVPTEGVSVALADVADQAMVKRLQRDIAAGRLKASPGVEVIRKHLKVGNDRARRLRDLLQAETSSATGRHAARIEEEAANA